MFRQFFPRKDKGRASDPQNTDQPAPARPLDAAEVEEARQKIAQFLPHPEVDDGVHRMALRSGKQKLPDDPDELAYANDQGKPAELAREALINLMCNIKTGRAANKIQMPADGQVKASLTSLEAPSAQLAARRLLDSWGFSFELTISDVYATPDPRLPLRPVEYQIWRYEGFEPVPVVPSPAAAIAQQIAELAQTPCYRF